MEIDCEIVISIYLSIRIYIVNFIHQISAHHIKEYPDTLYSVAMHCVLTYESKNAYQIVIKINIYNDNNIVAFPFIVCDPGA